MTGTMSDWWRLRLQALLASADDTPFGKVRPRDIQKLANSLKLKRPCGNDGIPKECLRHLPRRPLIHLTHLFNNCLRLSHYPEPWKEPREEPKFPKNLRSFSLLPMTGKLFEKGILKMVQRHAEQGGLLNAS
jgi:hypothetical protein